MPPEYRFIKVESPWFGITASLAEKVQKVLDEAHEQGYGVEQFEVTRTWLNTPSVYILFRLRRK